MPAQFQVNLIREELARRRMTVVRRQVLAVSLALFGVLQLVTLSIYFARNYQAATLTRKLQLRARTAGNDYLDGDQVQNLNRQSNALKAQLTNVSNVLKGTTAWPGVLVALAQCARETGVTLRRADAVLRQDTPLLAVEGVCSATHPARIVREFLDAAARQPEFSRGSILSMRLDERAGEVVFEADIHLVPRTLEAKPRPARVALVEAAPAAEDGPIAPAPDADAPEPDEPVADAPEADEAVADEPEAEAPEADVPEADAPEADTPEADTPEADEPVPDAPDAEEPVADAPEADAPEADAPDADAPDADAPDADTPEVDEPVPDAPDAEEPVADAPEAEEPVPDAPEADAPDAEEPVADAPEADEPDADEPDADEPEADAPDADEPDADEPDADEPEADAPDAEEPVADAPEADAPEADAPDADEPVADEPSADAPVADEPDPSREALGVVSAYEGGEGEASAAEGVPESGRKAEIADQPFEPWRHSFVRVVQIASDEPTSLAVSILPAEEASAPATIRASSNRPDWLIEVYDLDGDGHRITSDMFGEGWTKQFEGGKPRRIGFVITPVGARAHDRIQLRLDDADGRMAPVIIVGVVSAPAAGG